jgi:predicted Zn-dependent protease
VVAPPAESAVVSGDDRVARIRALADAGRSVEAHALAVSGTKADPGSVELHYLAAVILLERGDRLGAATAARRAAYLEPGLALVDIVLASALRGSGDLNGARRAYRRAHTELARADASALVRFGDGERAGGLLQMVETLIAALERQS